MPRASLRSCSTKEERDAAAGDVTFIRWSASGTGPQGRFEFSGVDRVRTRNGHVCENRIYCDDPFLARVAAALGMEANDPLRPRTHASTSGERNARAS